VSACAYCGSNRHPTTHCPCTSAGQGNRQSLRCSYCGGTDHNYQACTKHCGSGKLPGAVRIDRRG
jgi:hypothetical protein